jgi:Amidohydrolase family
MPVQALRQKNQNAYSFRECLQWVQGHALRVIDARGKIVTPGLIDLHAHVYPYGSAIGLPADETLRAPPGFRALWMSPECCGDDCNPLRTTCFFVKAAKTFARSVTGETFPVLKGIGTSRDRAHRPATE